MGGSCRVEKGWPTARTTTPTSVSNSHSKHCLADWRRDYFHLRIIMGSNRQLVINGA